MTVSVRQFRRCAFGAASILLAAIWWAAPAWADDSIDHCLDVRGQPDGPHLVNSCPFPVNAFVCCFDKGTPGNCDDDKFLWLAVGPNDSERFPYCPNMGAGSGCRQPLFLESIAWDESQNAVVAGQCIHLSSILGTTETEPRPLPDVIANNDNRTADGSFALAGVQMSGEDLRGIDFSGADLSNANLDDSNLFRVEMTGANCRGATFRGAYLQYTKLVGADLTHADFTGADMQGTRTREATFCNTTMPDGTINNDDCPP